MCLLLAITVLETTPLRRLVDERAWCLSTMSRSHGHGQLEKRGEADVLASRVRAARPGGLRVATFCHEVGISESNSYRWERAERKFESQSGPRNPDPFEPVGGEQSPNRWLETCLSTRYLLRMAAFWSVPKRRRDFFMESSSFRFGF